MLFNNFNRVSMKIFFRWSVIYLPLLVFSSCLVNKNVPFTKNLDSFPYGAQVKLKNKENSRLNLKSKQFALLAEIIAVENDTIYLKAYVGETKIYAFQKDQINRMGVSFSLTSDNPSQFSLWAGLLALSTLSHGFYATLTLPITLIAACNTAMGAAQSTYATSYPDKIRWNDLKKFARFPQGFPEAVTIDMLK
jgi:hypothetical protein